jgi:hypothetical protein
MAPKPQRLLAFAAALLLGACASAQGVELSRVQRKDVKVLAGAEGFLNPLTGVASYTPQDWQNRPILAVKIGNSAAERPQAGLDRADVVYEELVEGGITRFMALFSTNHAPRVGPVRSVRSVDRRILQPLGALYAYSGGVPPVVSGLRSTPGLTDVGIDRATSAYRRDDNRSSPYNLYASTDELWEGREGHPPKPQFDFLTSADDATLGGTEDANEIRLSFAGNGSEIRFSYDERTGTYKRLVSDNPHLVEGNGDGVQLEFRNVLIQMVDVAPGSTVDRAGDRSNEIEMIGEGGVALFRGGRAVRGRWTRSTDAGPTEFFDNSGAPMRLAPGGTIVELLPQGRDVFVS